jgi:spore germination protein YaaH
LVAHSEVATFVVPEGITAVPKKGRKEKGAKAAVANIIEKILHYFTRAANTLARFDDDQLEVIEYPHDLAVSQPPKEKSAKPVKVKKPSKVLAKSKEVGEKAKARLKTTTGKVIALNTIAVIGLGSYILLQPGKTIVTTKNTQDSPRELRNYLPVPSDYVNPRAVSSETGSATAAKIGLSAWLTPWNINELQEFASQYKSVSAFWGTLDTDSIHVVPKSTWESWETYRKLAPASGNQTAYLTITGNPEYVQKMLNTPDLQNQHIQSLLNLVKQKQFNGIDIDYEGLGIENSNLFTLFVHNLTSAFHSNGKLVAVTVEARLANQNPMDWHSLSEVVDELRIMVYDYHAQITNYPGPIAPLGWVKEILDYVQTVANPQKTVIALGNYGYDWQKVDDNSGWSGQGISAEQAIQLAKDHNTPVIRSVGIDERGYDIGSTANFIYTDSTGAQHSVWFEDNASLEMKLQLVQQYHVKGVMLWSVGLGDRSFWNNTNTRAQESGR